MVRRRRLVFKQQTNTHGCKERARLLIQLLYLDTQVGYLYRQRVIQFSSSCQYSQVTPCTYLCRVKIITSYSAARLDSASPCRCHSPGSVHLFGAFTGQWACSGGGRVLVNAHCWDCNAIGQQVTVTTRNQWESNVMTPPVRLAIEVRGDETGRRSSSTFK